MVVVLPIFTNAMNDSRTKIHPSARKTSADNKHTRRRCTGRLAFAGLALVLLLSGCVTAPKEYHEPVALAAQERTAHNLKVFDKVWTLVNKNYFDPKFRGVDWAAQREKYRPEAAAAVDEEALYRVINKMAAELKESHLHALSPRRTHEMSTEHRAAVGVFMQLIEGKRVVTCVLSGSPADAAGIKPGWIAVSRNGVFFTNPPVGDNFIARLGVPIRFAFLDEHDQPRELTLQPQLLNFQQRLARVLPDGTLYLRFDEFNMMESSSWLSEQLKKHRSAPAVVIDLRQNPGGKVFGLRVSLAELFEHSVEIGHSVKRSGRDSKRSSLSIFSAHFPGRVVVLVGPSTGSAAEIFSHVLQHEHRATIIGRKTAGAVINSFFYSLPDSGRLQVPVGDYIGLDGQRLEGHGVVPDIEVRLTLQDLRSGNDPELEAARAEVNKPTAMARVPSN